MSAPAAVTFDESFDGSTLNNPADWIAIKGGTEWPCLTGATTAVSLSVGTLEACANQGGSVAPAGQGVLRLTRDDTSQRAALLYNATLSASEGLDISFSIRMHGGTSTPADGLSFFLKDGTNVDNRVGGVGGALSYASAQGSIGLPGGIFAVGFDVLGAWAQDARALPTANAPCATPGPSGSQNGRLIGLRGPDTSAAQDGTSGYCYLGHQTAEYARTTAQRVRIVVDTFTPGQPTTVSAYLAPSATPSLLPNTPNLTAQVTISATTFKFGFAAATGAATQNHDISGLSIRAAGPAISSLATSELTGSGTGPTTGGTTLTITGSDIDPNATVTVDGQPCTSVTVTPPTTLTCVTPPGSPGAKEVMVTNPNGGPGYATFTYVNPTPTVTAVSPTSGTPSGGNTITITGTGFVAGASATVGASPCTSVNVSSSTSLTCVAPPGTDGSLVDVEVSNIGTTPGRGSGLYTYRQAATPSQPPPPTTESTTTTAAPTTVPEPNEPPATDPADAVVAETAPTSDGPMSTPSPFLPATGNQGTWHPGVIALIAIGAVLIAISRRRATT